MIAFSLLAVFQIGTSLPAPDACQASIRNAQTKLIIPSVTAQLPSFLKPTLSWIAGNTILRPLNTVYQQARNDLSPASIFDRALRANGNEVQVADEFITREGEPLLLAANHPSGVLDAFALLSVVWKQRQDVVIVADPNVEGMDEMDPMLINAHSAMVQRKIWRALEEGKLVIIFPAGRLSNVQDEQGNWQDGPWREGVVEAARRTGAPIVLAHIDMPANTHAYQRAVAFCEVVQRLSSSISPNANYRGAVGRNLKRLSDIMKSTCDLLIGSSIPGQVPHLRGEDIGLQFSQLIDISTGFSEDAGIAANQLRQMLYEMRSRD